MPEISKEQIGIAGVHFIAYKMSLRGLIVLPTTRNTGGIDILVSNLDGSKMAAIQVKTSGKKVDFWPTSKPEKILNGKNCYYAFLRYQKSINDFQVFLVEGKEVKNDVSKNAKYYIDNNRKEFSFFKLYKEDEEIYKKVWEEFTL